MLEEGFIDVSQILDVGVYILLRCGIVVYVGQSRSMVRRIASHKAGSSKKWVVGKGFGIIFDKVFVYPCTLDKLDAMEQALIKKYEPRYNVRHNPRPPRLRRVPRPLAEITASILAHRRVSAAPSASSRPSIDRRGR